MRLSLALLVAASSLAAQQSSVLPSNLSAKIAAIEPKLVAWRRDIHQHPELGNRETRTAKLVADHLRSLGIEVTEKVGYTGVIGLLKGGKPGPVVLLRADMDALPVTERANVPFKSTVRSTYNGQDVGVMHACGHDTHVAILMGVAEILAGMKADIPGTVKFMFQPAEEGAPAGEEGGAALMIKQGLLTNPAVDVGFALHIDATREVNHIFYTPGGMAASSDDYKIVVKGKSTHGAAPWNGVDPVVTSAHIITALQTVVSRNMDITQNASVVTVGMIRGGVRNNIVPEQVELIGTIRSLHPDDRKLLHARVTKIATDVASAMGATVEVDIGKNTAYPVTFNNLALTDAMLPALREAAGADKVHLTKPETGAEDFSFVAEKIPGFYIGLGGRPANVARENAADHHTPDFFVDDSGLDVGVRALIGMTLHYMKTNPKKLTP
jgi:amidohydrolase